MIIIADWYEKIDQKHNWIEHANIPMLVHRFTMVVVLNSIEWKIKSIYPTVTGLG